MPEIRPFRGYHYNPAKVGELKKVLSPPYDVISPEEQDILYNMSPYNIVRLTKGKELPEDTDQDNKYTRAAQTLQEWKRDEVLIPHRHEHIYVYEQEYFMPNGERRSRKGFIALMRVEPFDQGNVRPHEKTLAGPSQDRYRLLSACRANFGQIFALYTDPHGVIAQFMENAAKHQAEGEIVGWEETRHRFWHIHDPKTIQKIQEEMKTCVVYIADGHHRYETALKYMNHQKSLTPSTTGEEPWNFRMVTFIRMDDPGLTILPAHRLVKKLDSFDPIKVEAELLKYFDLHIFQFNRDNEVVQRKKMSTMLEGGDRKHRFGLCIRNLDRCYLLSLKDESVIDRAIDRNHCMAWRRLDTTILHSLILEKVLGVDSSSQELLYVKGDVETAVQRLYLEGYDAALFLNSTSVQEMKDVADAGERMPEKSTYFFPKLISGLIIYDFDLLGR